MTFDTDPVSAHKGGVADTEVIGNREINVDLMVSPMGGGSRPRNQSCSKFCETHKSGVSCRLAQFCSACDTVGCTQT